MSSMRREILQPVDGEVTDGDRVFTRRAFVQSSVLAFSTLATGAVGAGGLALWNHQTVRRYSPVLDHLVQMYGDVGEEDVVAAQQSVLALARDVGRGSETTALEVERVGAELVDAEHAFTSIQRMREVVDHAAIRRNAMGLLSTLSAGAAATVLHNLKRRLSGDPSYFIDEDDTEFVDYGDDGVGEL